MITKCLSSKQKQKKLTLSHVTAAGLVGDTLVTDLKAGDTFEYNDYKGDELKINEIIKETAKMIKFSVTNNQNKTFGLRLRKTTTINLIF